MCLTNVFKYLISNIQITFFFLAVQYSEVLVCYGWVLNVLCYNNVIVLAGAWIAASSCGRSSDGEIIVRLRL